MKYKIAMFALKHSVKFLKGHKNIIPGSIDDVIISLAAELLGV